MVVLLFEPLWDPWLVDWAGAAVLPAALRLAELSPVAGLARAVARPAEESHPVVGSVRPAVQESGELLPVAGAVRPAAYRSVESLAVVIVESAQV
jgi:hypothetical protein